MANQNLSIEMFLIRLIYLIGLKDSNEKVVSDRDKIDLNSKKEDNEKIVRNSQIEKKAISQMKNVAQQKKVINKIINNEKKIQKKDIKINSFNDLIYLCSNHKEIKLKYELENHVNL